MLTSNDKTETPKFPQPMMWPPETEYLAGLLDELPPDGKVVEWGSGGSTIFMMGLLKGDQSLLSIEHNEEWFNRVCVEFEKQDKSTLDRLTYVMINTRAPYAVDKIPTRKQGDEWFYAAGQPMEEQPSFNAHYIDPERMENIDAVFDASLYIVDGISRGAVLATILRRARKRDAVVLLHDYPGREDWYDWAAALYPSMERVPNTNFLRLKMEVSNDIE